MGAHLLEGVPGEGLDVLCVVHEHCETFKLGWPDRCSPQSSVSSLPRREVGTTASAPSQIQTLLSRLQEARSLPSALHSALLHSLSWPSSGSTASHSPSASAPPAPSSKPASSTCCQIPTVASNEAVARVVPVGLKARERTVRPWEVGIVDLCEKR